MPPAQDVQSAINASRGTLPDNLPYPPVYNKVNPADAPILTLMMTSDSLPLRDVNDYADSITRAENLADRRRRPRHHRRQRAPGRAHAGQSVADRAISASRWKTCVAR